MEMTWKKIKSLKSYLGRKFSVLDYFIIILATAGVLLFRFYDLFTSPSFLAGWDTIGHYYTFLKGLYLFQHGELRGYMMNWFGGMPVFYFYPAMVFWFMGAVAVIFPAINPVLIFKFTILLELALIPASFLFFARSFWPEEKVSSVAVFFFSLAYIFYQPFEYGSLGIGIAGAVPVGLLAEFWATNLVLVFLGFFYRLMLSESKRLIDGNFFGALIFGAFIVHSHILSMVFSAVFAGLIFLFRINWNNIKRIGILLVSLALLGAYSLYPLFAFLEYSSGWRMDAAGYFADPLFPLLAFDPSALFRGEFLVFNWIWFFIFWFFVLGFILLIKRRHIIMPSIFLVSFILIPRQFFASIFPSLPVHYYRVMPIIFFFYLAISIYGLQQVFSWLYKKWRFSPYFISIFLIFVLARQISNFSFGIDQMNIQPRIIDSYTQPITYYHDLEEYPFASEAKRTMKYFHDKKITSRVAPEMGGRSFMINIGSSHYFNTMLPMINNTPVLFGLYAESAYQLPFFFTPLEVLSKTNLAYGNVLALMADRRYLAQKPEQVIKEMSLFNVEYFIAGNKPFQESLAMASSSAERVDIGPKTEPFQVYKIKDVARSYVSYPKYLPAMYINEDGELSFREFALGWYKLFDILDFPVIFDHVRIKNLDKEDLSRVSFLIVHAKSLSDKDRQVLNSTGKPIVVLSRFDYEGELPEGATLIDNFRPGAGYYGQAAVFQPNYDTLHELQKFFEQAKTKFPSGLKGSPSLISWEDEKISFSAEGPTIVNASYFPNWRSQDNQQKIYQVTPGQMLVYAKGDTTINFSPGLLERISLWLSIISFGLVLIIWIIWLKRKK